jgi:hypothetical protein
MTSFPVNLTIKLVVCDTTNNLSGMYSGEFYIKYVNQQANSFTAIQ